MKILYIIDSLGLGGKERQLLELIKGLESRKDIRLQLVILSDNIHYSYVNDLNVEIYYLKRKIKKDPGIFIKLYKICKEIKPDIIHSWESMCSVYATPIVRILGIRFINGQVRYAPSKLKLFSIAWIRTQSTFIFSDVILGNSYAGLKSFRAPQHKSYCIHNGFDFSRTENLQERELIRQKFKIRTPYVVGMVARFHINKDYETFIMSAMKILQKRKDVTFLTIGDGPTLDKCRSMVTRGFQDKIKFLGKQEEIESIVNIFDIGVLASYADGISNSIMEYMALAKPVVATNDGGTNEIVDNNKTGFLVEPENVDELVEKVEFLLNNDVIAKAMGSAGKERLLKEFSLEKMTGRYIELYQKCIDAKIFKGNGNHRKSLSLGR